MPWSSSNPRIAISMLFVVMNSMIGNDNWVNAQGSKNEPFILTATSDETCEGVIEKQDFFRGNCCELFDLPPPAIGCELKVINGRCT